MLWGALRFYNYWTSKGVFIFTHLLSSFFEKTLFIKRYYLINDLMWQDGFLIDFLQKKVLDKWTRRFLILSAYLFNERLVFDALIKFYLDLVLWVGHRFVIFEFTNVASLLFTTFTTLIFLFLLFTLLYLSVFIF